MNRKQRERWLVLGRVNIDVAAGFSLCNMCRHAYFSGGCEDAELECECGIESIEENCYSAWEGSDCWAFRPRFVYEDCVDALGLALQGFYPDWKSLRTIQRKKKPMCQNRHEP